MKIAKATKLTCWEQYFSVALDSKFVQWLSPIALHSLGLRVPPVCQRWGQMTSDCEELCQEVIKLTGNGAAESDVTFLEYVLCEQVVPVAGEVTDAEIVQTATNRWDSREDGNDEPPR
ncbi:hypothetical protein HPB50_007277 [Hyalomma asiaticum]|uniref:Uncharacterized protein n=1 Tax=Hyalomma asiaticum TaxID=266040 RepID=A0ACB7RV67_HYAAI|nr:hypothetical protein HPB50_007277 [Hyalomma asiaticum]